LIGTDKKLPSKGGSRIETPFWIAEYSEAFSDFMKTWMENLVRNNMYFIDWRIWLPNAFWPDWSDRETWQKSMFDPTIWLPMAFYPKEERKRTLKYCNIAGDIVMRDKAGGDIAGYDVFKNIKNTEREQVQSEIQESVDRVR
jgi:hypothetical protein